jgi:hypothetical protein
MEEEEAEEREEKKKKKISPWVASGISSPSSYINPPSLLPSHCFPPFFHSPSQLNLAFIQHHHQHHLSPSILYPTPPFKEDQYPCS